jgi:uncharacterized protein with PIN domain
MAIPCPSCGREYDVTLFQFGRTVHCTCGSRVGLQKRLETTFASDEPRFMVDAMLGGLARWLRILGFDAAFDAEISDEELVRRGLEEGRHILSRDRGLSEAWRVTQLTILEEEDEEAQLKVVLDRFELAGRIRLFTRCTLCNVLLVPEGREEVGDRVPERVLETKESFARCPSCHRVYWEGSHTERIRGRLKDVLGGWGESPQ